MSTQANGIGFIEDEERAGKRGSGVEIPQTITRGED